MSKPRLSLASENGIRVYPLIEGYGHLEWFFTQKDHLRYAEDPDKPFALNFTDPQAVSALESIVGEADDLFAAPAFHIGLDEVIGKVEERGRFPYRSKPRAFADLYITAATHWRDYPEVAWQGDVDLGGYDHAPIRSHSVLWIRADDWRTPRKSVSNSPKILSWWIGSMASTTPTRR